MSFYYLVLPRLKISNANAQPAYWLVGPPPVTAYAGFAHALALACGADGHSGIAIVHHDIEFLGDMNKYTLSPHQYRSASFIDADDYAGGVSLSSQPSARANIEVSLVIRFNDETTFDAQKVITFLRSARIAGGNVNAAYLLKNGLKKEVINKYWFDDGFEKKEIVSLIGTGFSLIERQDLMVKDSGDKDALDTLLRVTRREKGVNKNPWLHPSTLGYSTLTDFENREGVREGLAHAFVEPMVGLVQYVPLRDAGFKFWRYHQPQPNYFVVTTN